MSSTMLEPTTAQTSAAAVLRVLPVPDLGLGESIVGLAAVSSAIPGEGARAVSANLTGTLTGSIVIVVTAEIAAQIENGPLGAQDFVAALTPGLDDVVASLGVNPGDVQYVAPQGLEAEVALSNATTHESITVVPFLASGVPVGSLVVLLDAVAQIADFSGFGGDTAMDGAIRRVELLSDVEMGVTAELGRTRLTVRELLSLQPGAIVELDRSAGSPVDLLVNGTLVARGEVVVIDEEFGIRITEIVGQKPEGK